MKRFSTWLRRMCCTLMAFCVFTASFASNAYAASYSTGYPNTYKNTGNAGADMVGIAKTQIGYKETGTNYTKYGAWYGLNGESWCAIFVSWVADQAGILNTKVPKFASCTSQGVHGSKIIISGKIAGILLPLVILFL